MKHHTNSLKKGRIEETVANSKENEGLKTYFTVQVDWCVPNSKQLHRVLWHCAMQMEIIEHKGTILLIDYWK